MPSKMRETDLSPAGQFIPLSPLLSLLDDLDFNCSNNNHRLRGSGSTVVTMTSKVNGKTEISTSCRSETP